MTTTDIRTSHTGIYGIPEAARYLYVTVRLEDYYKPTPRHLIRWIRQGLTSPTLANVHGRELLIDFEDLISMRVISFLHAIGVPFNKIRQTETYLHKLTGHSRPFATEQLWTETTDIFAEIGPLLITASRSGQLPFLELVRQNLVNVHDLTFRQGIANSWAPIPGILLKPEIQLGTPCIAGTGIPTHAVWRMFMGGDDIEFIAHSYATIKGQQIQKAIDWEERLARVTFTTA